MIKSFYIFIMLCAIFCLNSLSAVQVIESNSRKSFGEGFCEGFSRGLEDSIRHQRQMQLLEQERQFQLQLLERQRQIQLEIFERSKRY